MLSTPGLLTRELEVHFVKTNSMIDLRGAWSASVIVVGNISDEAAGCLPAAIHGTVNRADQRGEETLGEVIQFS